MQNEIEAKKSAEREDQMKSLPAPVQEAIDAYGKYYAKHHKLGMSVRDDMTYIAQMAMRWVKPNDATEIESAADDLRWYSKHLGDFNGKPNKPWVEHFNDDINALRDMALMEKARADWLAADVRERLAGARAEAMEECARKADEFNDPEYVHRIVDAIRALAHPKGESNG